LKSKVTTAPASEPVSLAELKLSLRITDTAQDTILTQYITDARDMAERYTGRKFIEQTLTGYTDKMYGRSDNWFSGHRIGHVGYEMGNHTSIVFDWSPAISITSVETVDSSNTENTYASTNYYLDNYDNDKFPKIEFNDSADLPADLRNRNAWKVVWKAGYGTASTDVPASIRRAIIMIAGYLYENRGDCEGDCVEGCGAAKMLNSFKLVRG
jgi:hypothetical protein